MNDDMQYKEMLEIPVNSCNITYKPLKRKKRTKKFTPEEVKERLVNKVNQSAEEGVQESVEESNEVPVLKENGKKRSLIVSVQLAVIGVLVACICLTNAFIKDSAMNVFFAQIFKPQSEVVDTREYNDFTPTFSIAEGQASIEEGVMKVSKIGSVYTSLDGNVSSVSSQDGKFTVEITHNDNFKTVFSGLDYVYVENGANVYGNIPLGYSVQDGYSVCFYSAEGIITEYTLSEGQIVWAV